MIITKFIFVTGSQYPPYVPGVSSSDTHPRYFSQIGYVGRRMKQNETPINSEQNTTGVFCMYDMALCSVVIIVKKIERRWLERVAVSEERKRDGVFISPFC